MTAICKTIAVHGNHLSALLDYGEDSNKTALKPNTALSNLFAYGQDENKTAFVNPLNEEKSLLVSGVQCTPSSAEYEFDYVKNLYFENGANKNRGLSKNKKPVHAIHLIQSFQETNISPIVAHQIGKELLERHGYMGVVDTHMNKTHVHNHIIINSYYPDGNSKIHLNKDFIVHMREMSDSIQLDYGIPISFDKPREQLQNTKDSLHYGEWASQRTNKSWKSSMYEAMNICHSLTENETNYIEYMGRFGYELASKKKNGDLLWYNHGKTRKILESTLYKNYTNSIQRSKEYLNQYIDYAYLYYSWDGRELNDIQNTFNKTYNTIVTVLNYLISTKKNLEIKSHHFEYKKTQMKLSQELSELYNINSSSSLDNKLNEVGKNLSITKHKAKELSLIHSYFLHVNDLIQTYLLAKDSFNEQAEMIDLHVKEISSTEIAHNNAALSPISNTQKQELYLLMKKHPQFRLTYGDRNYSCISTKDLFEIKNYFIHGNGLPTALMPTSEYNFKTAYERQYDFLKKRFSYKPYATQLKTAMDLLKAAGHDTSHISELTLADIINIQNCYGPAPELEVDFGPLASINDLENLKAICKQINYSPIVEYSSLTAKQCRKLYIWACSRGKVPFCITQELTEKEQNIIFEESIKDYPPNEQEIIRNYRSACIELKKIGLKIDELDIYCEQSRMISDEYNLLLSKINSLSSDYKNLIHLKQNLLFTQDKNYIFGSDEIEKSYLRSIKVDDNLELKSKIYDFNRRKEREKNIDYDF